MRGYHRIFANAMLSRLSLDVKASPDGILTRQPILNDRI